MTGVGGLCVPTESVAEHTVEHGNEVDCSCV